MDNPVLEGFCWGGPLHGKWAASRTDYIRAVLSKKESAELYKRLDDNAKVSADLPNCTFYNIQRFRIGGKEFRVWVINQPKERKEVVLQTIVEGMTVIHILCNL